ncbi:hypothetical protein L596_011982 [Steinernema carpocapsae]|uniref:Uncharacterized protein n=1 Tax=Steinernema carpocapsae TaxID=34508 RepID=A0A4U5NWC7_STECR|nr:hypothetical protein L596_011982 [Steinernema carpocapsae]
MLFAEEVNQINVNESVCVFASVSTLFNTAQISFSTKNDSAAILKLSATIALSTFIQPDSPLWAPLFS